MLQQKKLVINVPKKRLNVLSVSFLLTVIGCEFEVSIEDDKKNSIGPLPMLYAQIYEDLQGI